MKRVGVIFRPQRTTSEALAKELIPFLAKSGIETWLASAWDDDVVRPQVADTDLIVCIGGDGTILRAARHIVPHAVPMLGVNLGNVGFMTEVGPNDVFDVLPRFLAGEGWVEERAMLAVAIVGAPPTYHCLNDAVVARGAHCRIIQVEARVDGEFVASYKADALIAATASGSTAYSLAAGGPILYPEARAIILTPVAVHLAQAHSLVLPPTATVEIVVHTELDAILSIDGQIDLPLRDGDVVEASLSPHHARFLRLKPRSYFYGKLALPKNSAI